MNKLKYSLLTAKDIPSTINCVIRVFLYEELMTRLLGMSEPEFKVFVEAICKKVAKERLSYICKNKNNVLGFCLSEDLIAEPFDESVKITPKMNPIFDILNQLDAYYLKNKKRTKKRFFHLFMVGTFKEYRGMGIAKKLTGKSLILAKKMKFKTIVTEATNIKSQNLLKKYFKFRALKRINYKTFKFNGKFPFKNLGKESCNLMELGLG